MLNAILTFDNLQYFPDDQTFYHFQDLDTKLDINRIMNGFYGAFATTVACQQGALTLPGTWFRPFMEPAYAPIVQTSFSELVVSFRDFSLECPQYFLDFTLMRSQSDNEDPIRNWLTETRPSRNQVYIALSNYQDFFLHK